MASRPKGDGGRTARTVHVGSEDWERVLVVAFMSKPRRSASDVVREMIATSLPRFEDDLRRKDT